MSRVTTPDRVLHLDEDRRAERPDTLVAEEPLEIRLGGHPLSVTMRTPGHDFDLVAGFLVTEGVIASTEDLASMRYCAGADPAGAGAGADPYNVVDVVLPVGRPVPELSLRRNFSTNSSCGVCGKASIEAIRTRSRWTVAEDPVRIDPDLLFGLPDAMRAAQRVFDRTGGLHAAGLFTAGATGGRRPGELLCVREDVGRHNAVDKVVGWALRQDLLPLRGCVLMVSGRASFELIQKALMAGIPVLAAVSAPSSLAVELAKAAEMTLVGFLRGRSANVYAGAHRVSG